MKTPPTPQPLTRKSFLAWLEKQPADRKFCYGNLSGCLFASWARETGHKKATCGGTGISPYGPKAMLVGRVRLNSIGLHLINERVSNMKYASFTVADVLKCIEEGA